MGGRVPRTTEKRSRKPNGPPDAFGLFCAYHLGVTPDDGYHRPSLDDTARRYGVTPDEIKNLLVEHKLDNATMAELDFDLEGARLDVRVAPEGISRTEIARNHYEFYLEALETA